LGAAASFFLEEQSMTSRIAIYLNRLRNRHFFVLDLLILLLTPFLALALRVDYPSSARFYLPDLYIYMVYAIPLRLLIFRAFGLYQRFWRYASIEELAQLTLMNLVAAAVVVTVFFGLRLPVLHICPAFPEACGLPRSVPILDSLLIFLFISGVRFAVRFSATWRRRKQGATSATPKRVLIVGAGEAGAMIAKKMRTNPSLGLEPIGFVDDDLHKHDVRIHGLPVLGNRHDIPSLTRQHAVRQVIIAIPTAPGRVIREILAICESADVHARTMPGIYELLDETVQVNQLRDVQIEDLLRREPIHTDTAAVQTLLRGKRVLITGGGGSIGSELCRQVWRCAPAQLIVLGHGENSIFEIVNELRVATAAAKTEDASAILTGEPLEAVIADIRFPGRIHAVMQHYRPQVVFHAAAHKHVPLMEQNPGEAITNNVLGTRNVLDAALAADVAQFVMISTDKAVNPTSVMGASKRCAELLVHRAAKRSGKPYVAVRFGNVLGSRGSVVLTFQKQIAAGGPVTVTHPDMRRYFMTIPEAVQLVLQAAVLGHGGEVFVLDMGDPVRIVDLAQDLIELSGLEVGQDIEIVYTGMRPGEKLYEELFVDGERYERTRHQKIFIAANASSFVPADLETILAAMRQAAEANDRHAIMAGLQRLIPEFQPPELESRRSAARLEQNTAPQKLEEL
jgi:FlaA1/EpsC-like NDP-sugar epimerase